MAGRRTEQTKGFVYWDSPGAGANPIAPFQIVGLATAAEVTAAIAAGVTRAAIGQLVVPMPTAVILGATMSARRVIGVTANAAFSGDELLVITEGIAEVMVNAAVAADAMLFSTALATRTTVQTPLTSLLEMLLPFDPRATLTYNLAMADDPALVPTTGAGTNTIFYPIGIAMAPATAQYDVIPVELMRGPLYG
jgi:hypothetical protein